jgi:hypothetical protein
MMLEELGLVVNDASPFKCGVVTLFAFIILGILPIIPYIVSAGFNKKSTQQQVLPSLIIGGF